MPVKGYTTPELVTAEMGGAFEIGPISEFQTLVSQAEAYIDRYTGRAWLVASPITDELHTVLGPYLYLKSSPVTAITSFRVRLGAVGAPDVTLTAGSQYELIDGPHGIVLVNATYPFGYDVVVNTTEYAGYISKVSYSTVTPVPGDIQRAATLIVAGWLNGRGNSDMRGVKSYQAQAGEDRFQVTFRDQIFTDEVQQLLKARKATVLA